MNNILLDAKRVHFIGIGGISMSSIAFVLNKLGCTVSGSDAVKSSMTDSLANAGIKIIIGHSPANITNDVDIVVYTADIRADNCELVKAKELGITCMVRAVALGLLMKSYQIPVGVSGTHGKSTTTSMLSEVFTAAGADPTVLSGAELDSNKGAYRLGNKKYFIFEACEYTASFLNFFPKIAVVLNVEEDHLDYYKDISEIKTAFSEFINLCGEDGTAVLNADNPNTLDAAREYKGNKVTFAINNDADFVARNIKYSNGCPEFDVFYHGEHYLSLKLRVYGEHNIIDSLASVATAFVCGLSKEKTAEALDSFSGAKRRFEFVGKCNGADIVSDYAHHPTEIETTLKAAKSIGYKKVVCVFQPHTYKRVSEFFSGMVSALSIADQTVLAPVYAKRDTNVTGLDSGSLSDKIAGSIYLHSLSEIAEYIRKNAKEEELYILMGAGDINKVSTLL